MSLIFLPVSLLIIIILIPNYYNTEIQTYKYFYATINDNSSIVLLTTNEIHFLDFNFISYKLLYSFGSEQFTNENAKNVYIKNYPDDQCYTFMAKLNTNYYLIFPTQNKNEINYTSTEKSIIIPYKCENCNTDINCIFFDANIISNSTTDHFIIEKKQITKDGESTLNTKKFDLISSENYLARRRVQYLTCEIMGTNKNNKNLIVCFYQISTYELVSTSYEINSFNSINDEKLNIYQVVDSLDSLKSILSPNSNNIALIYYVQNYSPFNLYCLLYNSTGNSFTSPKLIINLCDTNYVYYGIVKNTKHKYKKEYLIYCHVTNSKMLQYSLINETSLANKEILFSFSIFNLEDCEELYSCAAFFIDGKYFFKYTCKNSNQEIISKKSEIDMSEFSWSSDDSGKEEEIENDDKVEEKKYIEEYLEEEEKKFIEEEKKNEKEFIEEKNDQNIEEEFITKEFEEEEKIQIKEENKNEYEEEINEEIDDKEIIKSKINITKNDIENSLSEIINTIEIGKKYKIEGEDFSIKIHPINEKLGENSTFVNFSECESILRKKLNLSENYILTTMLIEIESTIENSLTNQVKYAIYDEDKNKLDLSYCENTTIKINYEINDPSVLDKDLIKSFSEKGIDILNSNDNFFHDICIPYDVNDTDVILADRISDIYQNFSLCESDCTYDNINLTTNIISCSCNIKTNISYEEETPTFSEMVKTTFKNTNFAIIKCYHITLNMKNLNSNFGFWIFAIISFLHIPLFIYYFLKEIKSVGKFVADEMKKNNYFIKEQLSKKMINNPIKKKKHILKSTECINSNIISKCKSEKTGKMLNFSSKKKKLFSSSCLNKSSISRYEKNKKTKKNKAKNKSSIHIPKNIINKKKFEEKNCPGYYNLILIDLNSKKIAKFPESKYILNYYNTFAQAKKYDVRDFWRICFICLLHRQSVMHTFFYKSLLEPQSLRICLFIFHYSCDFFLNAFFYLDNKISDRYQYTGDNLYLYSLVNNLIITVCSTLISFVLRVLFKYLINSKQKIESIFREQEQKIRKKKKIEITFKQKKEIMKKVNGVIGCLHRKITVFIILEFFLMIFFTYYISVFCVIYKSTQISWLSDGFMSFIMSNLMELIIALCISVIYTASIKSNLEILYKISIFIYDLGH